MPEPSFESIPAPPAPEERLGMVAWYDPGQLARTASEVVVSTVLGRHWDKRLTELFARKGDPKYSYADSGTLWIDYVADTGDGWNSTYAVAAAVGAPDLVVDDPDGDAHRLPRGRLLVFGGDEVYPVASREEYERRLIRPYETAFPWSEGEHPHVFAIPGNHDWYDSLVSFTRFFCAGESVKPRWIGGWQVRQSRSYFALQLPGHWWLLGTDVQLKADIDQPQVEFFRRIEAEMGEKDRVILCNAVPDWIYQQKYDELSPDYQKSNLYFLENQILRGRVAVVLAGDSHFYRHHATPDDRRHKIVAGGGGAFTHPTHDLGTKPLHEEAGHFEYRKSFPEAEESKRYCWRNLAFPWLNWKFAVLTAVVYALTAWIVLPLRGFDDTPGPLLWVLTIGLGFYLFTDTHSRWYRRIAGPAHAVAHLGAACLLGWGLTVALPAPAEHAFLHKLLLRAPLMLAGGWLLGGLVMGTYLLVSLNRFGRHSNEAFSALRSPDWKSFLRLRVDPDGTLTIFPIGIRRVPRAWKEASSDGALSGPQLVSADSRATPPALIEPPIVVAP